MSLRRWILLGSAVLAGAWSRPLAAQQVDVVRGRITSPENLPVEGAQITVTTVDGGVSRIARTDRNGRFMVTVPGGEGDYYVQVAAIGFLAKRFEIKRVADEEILLADAKLNRNLNELETVRVQGARDRPTRNDNSADIGGSEKRVESGQLTADQLGNLAAMAASTPGTLLVPGADGDPSGFSVFGLSSDQNSTTLNGQNFSGANLPRDAQVSGALATSPYDVSRGGFSGGNFNFRPRSGSNVAARGMSLVLDAPALQWTDATARALGQEYGNLSLGGSVSGPIVYNAAFYNVSYQLGRRSNDLRTLLNTDALGLQGAGISPDSAARLLSVLNGLNIPLQPAGRTINERLSDQGSLFGTFDVAPPASKSGSAYNLTTNLSWNRTDPLSSGSSEFPAHSGNRTDLNGGLQARHSGYFGFGVLSETTVGYSQSRSETDPYLDGPSGSVRVQSVFPDGTQGIKTVQFGGSPLAQTNNNSSLAFTNQLSWFSENSKHRVKLTSEVRRDAFTLFQRTNTTGSFAYNSIGELAAGQAGVFTRQIGAREREGNQLVGALSLGDAWRVTPTFQLQFGVRVDANRFNAPPPENPQVVTLFGTSNATVPNRLYASPRIGFSWAYGEAPQIAGFEGAFRGPRAIVRGGIGMFQGTPGTTALTGMFDNTGLPSGIQQVACAGPAVPAQAWGSWISNPSTTPTACGGGFPSFGSTVPNVLYYADDYNQARSLRANLQWQGPILANRFSATFDATWSRNLSQMGGVDRNFLNTTRFALPNEGNRPVFVPLAAIDTSTGAISAVASRFSPLFYRVTELRSDLTSESRQFRAQFSPTSFNTNYGWSLAYVYGEVKEQVRGFGGATGGDPNLVEWSRGGFDIRHQIQYSLFANLFDAVRLSWNGSFRSPQPFTPIVGGDVNGDGYNNDRAFIPNPATTTDPALGSAVQSLLASSPDYVRECLQRQLGQVALRNSCDGPWTSTASLAISFNPVKLRLPQRAQLSFLINNPLGAIDLVAHGENHLAGWGQQAFPDATLLFVRGFDPATQRFKYQVNPRFGSANPLFSTFRTPVTVTALLRFDVGPTREEQTLYAQLNLGRRTDGTRLNEGMLRAIYGSGGVVNPMASMLRQVDTLKLTVPQADELATMNRKYTIRLDSIWAPVAKSFAALPDAYDEGDAYAQYRRAREATVDLLISYVRPIQALLTDAQRRRLPPLIASALDVRYLQAIRSGTAGGAGGATFGGGPGFNTGGGGGGGMQMIIR